MAAATRKPYLTDLTDDQWGILQPLIPSAKPGGRPREVDMREVVNTRLCWLSPPPNTARSGVTRDAVPTAQSGLAFVGARPTAPPLTRRSPARHSSR
jgi:transposase